METIDNFLMGCFSCLVLLVVLGWGFTLLCAGMLDGSLTLKFGVIVLILVVTIVLAFSTAVRTWLE